MRITKLPVIVLLSTLVFIVSGCNESFQNSGVQDKETIKDTDNDTYIVGQVEKVTLTQKKFVYKARIDTGATTCSASATDIVEFIRDGKKWVRFNMINPKTNEKVQFEKRISRIVPIKRHGAKDQMRKAVKLPIELGEIHDVIEFTLTDRSKFEYPILIGRNFLAGNAIVDCNQKYTGAVAVSFK